MTDRIPIDVLATYLPQEALDRINRIYSPERQARQVDLELAHVGLAAVWEDSEHGPVMMEIRRRLPPNLDESDSA
ncbi:hypothetical protein [Methylobacterium brachythecii]|uniref:Uncharacterized protein n=1 Tax=Methylobacterium brachythecii TaxID=1176177 RepID=A0A7W6AGT5_9HYPH|nr:hypothetical protein [Methylobacterium brachythecii]MBB3902066.1 hypothetical protein [Methylobacterium brachythecii]GLS44462.1 hypothetical protein GCM10007884_24500 [Methylobacterium brachythecii]